MLLPRVVLVRIFPNNIIKFTVSLFLSLSGERVSLFLRLYYDKLLLLFISSDIARGVYISRSSPVLRKNYRARVNFCGKKRKKMTKKEFKSTATTTIRLLLLLLLPLLILLEFSVFVFVFDAFIELVKFFKFGQTSLDPFLPL